jgi:hypothetical protein
MPPRASEYATNKNYVVIHAIAFLFVRSLLYAYLCLRYNNFISILYNCEEVGVV